LGCLYGAIQSPGPAGWKVGITVSVLPAEALRSFSLSLIIRAIFAFVFLLQVFLKVFKTSYKLAFIGQLPGTGIVCY